ncbi:P pilus assembly chaperone PapD [Pseudomonas nitritireducens]|uniref:P pilus assembly chaperone PapD n=1 Tax=Pseudomonas nitroreducens TaxID=46680 RepID=A0A7W7P0D5_PSENT|nr:molecular chaperone [Pseudomonas nitritireducens]MBB4862534.1 P pilus assembly chaperone PapD [Pseudomonas nitritireducens]
MSSNLLRSALLGLALLAGATAHAGVTAERTRVIFDEGQREASLELVNQNTYPVIVQTWIDDGDLESAPQSAQAPIMPLPPVFRLNPGQQRSLRLLYTGEKLPGDRESLYWLNLYEIPPQPGDALAEGQSRLTVTLRTQMKVIYRPRALNKAAEEAPRKLVFRRQGNAVQVENPTPYFITLAGGEVRQGEAGTPLPAELLAPFSQRLLTPSQPLPAAASQVRYLWIDDGGNSQQGEAPLR